MPAVRIGPIIGLIVQVALLTTLAATIQVGLAGWVAGLAYALFTCGALIRGLRRSGASALGPADWVTLTRATLVGGVTALAADSLFRPVPVGVLVAITTVALLLDAVDGPVARRTGTASEFGGRFDMEVDAFLILVLSVYVVDALGMWVLAIGTMRYAFVATSWVQSWMRRPLPPRFWRKAVAATQGVVLTGAAAELFPTSPTIVMVGSALALLIESFGRDTVWLWVHRHGSDTVLPGRTRSFTHASQPKAPTTSTPRLN